MRRHLHAEWTKLRTVPGAGWLPFAVVALTVGGSAAAAATVTCPPAGCAYDVPRLSLIGVQLGQAVVAILAVVAISGEYGTGMIRTTLTAMPCRTAVLAAKALLLTGVTLAAGTVAVLGSVLAGRLLLPGNGFTPAHDHPLLSLADAPTLRAAAGSVLYLALIALFSLGVAVAVRDSATAIGVVLGVLYLSSITIYLVQDPDWQRLLYRVSPMNAGLTVQATTGLSTLPLSPWAGLGVLAAWAAAALLGGGLLLRRRDA
ncbi:ABC transporter permease [Nonomuraea sp. NPDC046570]|uniref:ABC transporter permease n=1 Tax=Nonomuraea sp. NPDC046570 TaxID=3155255 RepID=UPI0033C9ED61